MELLRRGRICSYLWRCIVHSLALISTITPAGSFSPQWTFRGQCSIDALDKDAGRAHRPCPAANLWIFYPTRDPRSVSRARPALVLVRVWDYSIRASRRASPPPPRRPCPAAILLIPYRLRPFSRCPSGSNSSYLFLAWCHLLDRSAALRSTIYPLKDFLLKILIITNKYLFIFDLNSCACPVTTPPAFFID